MIMRGLWRRLPAALAGIGRSNAVADVAFGPDNRTMQSQMSTLQLLIYVAANLLPLALLLSAIVLIIWARRRHAVKRAGVSADSPGCTRCRYLVRGWHSPLCPECGTDVRAAGVCTGPRVHLAVKLIAAGCMAACLAVALGSLIGMWLLTSHQSMAAWRLSDSAGAFEIDLRSYNERQKFPARDDHHTVITIDAARSFGGLVIGFDGWSWRDVEPPPGKTSEAWRRIHIGPEDEIPSAEAIADEITKAAGSTPVPLASQQAAWIRQQVVILRSKPPNTAGLVLAPNLFSSSGNGAGSGVGLSRLGNAVIVWSLIVSMLLTIVLVWGRHRPGWRPVVEGEWERAGGTPAKAAQQLAT